MNKAKVLVLDVIEGTGFYETEVHTLDDYYKHLKCDCFDIAYRKVDGKYFDIFCDDVGLFKEKIIVSAIDQNLKGALVGNLIFANHDSAGNTTSLSDEDIEHIRKSFVKYFGNDGVMHTAVYPVDY